MSLLALEHVSKSYRHGAHKLNALNDVCLQLDGGELVAIWGLRHSGRSTLLRLAAGIEAPDTGTVRFAEGDLMTQGACALANGIAYCRPYPHAAGAHGVLDAIIAVSLARGERPAVARALAEGALERAGAKRCTELELRQLDSDESIRVAIAQALATGPSLMLIDEPTKGVDLLHRDGILKLLRSIAKDGIAVLATVGESTGLFGADRALSLSDGQMHGHVIPELAPVVRLPQRVSA